MDRGVGQKLIQLEEKNEKYNWNLAAFYASLFFVLCG